LKSSSITKQLAQTLPPRSRLWTPNNLKAVITWLTPRRLFRLGLGTGFSRWRDAKGNTDFVQTDASLRPSITQSKTVFKGLLVPEFSSGDRLADETPTDKLDVGDGDFYIMAAIRTGAMQRGTIVSLQRENSFTPAIQLHLTQTRAGIFLNGDVLGTAFPAQTVIGTTNLSLASNTIMLVYFERINNELNVYLNGTKDNSAAVASTGDVDNNAASILGNNQTSGTGQQFIGKIAEVVIGGSRRKNIIGDKQRQLLEGYMAHNCGIASVLPDSHPYKKGPPRV
jgi:hypothetical protein